MLQPNKYSPLRQWWDPELVFTGVSIMSLSPESGWCSSVCVTPGICDFANAPLQLKVVTRVLVIVHVSLQANSSVTSTTGTRCAVSRPCSSLLLFLVRCCCLLFHLHVQIILFHLPLSQLENQQFLSFEAVRHLVGQLTTLAQAPRGLDTPDFLVLRRFADCDVRR